MVFVARPAPISSTLSGFSSGKHVGGHHLRGCVGDQDLALVELARKRGDQQRTAFGNAQAALNVHVAERHRLHFLFRALEGLEHVLVVHLAGVDGHVQRGLLVGCAHELDGGLRAHLLHELFSHPRGERLGAGKRIKVGSRVAEREIDAQAHDLVQHGVGHARRRARAERLHHFHALIDRRMSLLAQEDELVRGDLQRIARLAEDVLGELSARSMISSSVPRALTVPRASSVANARSSTDMVDFVDHLGDDVLRERVALANGSHHVERRQASGRCVGLATRTCRLGRTAEAALLAAARRVLATLLRLATRVASGVAATEIGFRLTRGAIGAGMLRALGDAGRPRCLHA